MENLNAEQLKNIEAWVFDLDNTLYPFSSSIKHQMSGNIEKYTMKITGLDRRSASAVQKKYLNEYGTTLYGLINEYEIDAGDYLDFVHNIDYSTLKRNFELEKQLKSISAPKYIFTNGTKKHTENVLDRLGVSDLFENVFDVIDSDLIPKPHKSAFDKFLEKVKINPKKSIFLEDRICNLKVPKQQGYTTVLVGGGETPNAERQSLTGSENIDYKTSSVESFLKHRFLQE